MSEDPEGPIREADEAASDTHEDTAEMETPAAVEPPTTESAEATPQEPAAPQVEPPVAPPIAPPADHGAASSAGAPAKAEVGKRLVAALIDFAVAFVIGFVPGVGQLLGSGYLILRDGLELDFMSHRSLGKQVMKLHLETVDGQPLELMTSVRRNWIFGIGPLVPLLFFIPFIGWLMIPFVLFAAIALGITELVLALTDADGRRLGDKWANTMVVED